MAGGAGRWLWVSRVRSVHFTSTRQDWRTPPDLYAALDAEFSFVLDAAASPDNALAERYYTEADDGLSRSWTTATFCNPPYNVVGRWIEKAAAEQRRGVTSVLLIPARTDTRAWHRYIFGRAGVEVRFLAGRLRFSGSAQSAPFPSAVVVFRPFVLP